MGRPTVPEWRETCERTPDMARQMLRVELRSLREPTELYELPNIFGIRANFRVFVISVCELVRKCVLFS